MYNFFIMSAEGPDLQMKFGKQTQAPVQMYLLKNRRGFSILVKASDWDSQATWQFRLFALSSDL